MKKNAELAAMDNFKEQLNRKRKTKCTEDIICLKQTKTNIDEDRSCLSGTVPAQQSATSLEFFGKRETWWPKQTLS